MHENQRSQSSGSVSTLARRLRRMWRDVHGRLLFVPLAFVVGAIALSQLTLEIDRNLGATDLPRVLQTTVGSADSILSTIAGGLISAITLLLSLVLVTVQLASSQFSPRTLRDWIGDRTQKRTIGVVLGTTVFCLMVLRETKSVDDSFALAPHVSVLVAVSLAVLSLVGVVRSVDHLSNNMRVGVVAKNLAAETLGAVERLDELPAPAAPDAAPATDVEHTRRPSERHRAIPAPTDGWVQRVDIAGLLDRIPTGSTADVRVAPGAFVVRAEPLAWIDGAELDDDECARIGRSVAEIAETRIVDHDVSYGLLQMSDIALRALSPGINDPNTAADVIVRMSSVLLALWERPEQPGSYEFDGRRVQVPTATHDDYLQAAYAQILRYGAADYDILATLIRSLATLRREVCRRDLAGPVEPIDRFLDELRATVDRGELSVTDARALHTLLNDLKPPSPNTGAHHSTV